MKNQIKNQYELFKIPFASAPQSFLLKQVAALSQKPQGSSVLFANAHVVVETDELPEFKKIVQGATLVIPDGVPLEWVLHLKGEKQAERYSGQDLMEDLFLSEGQKKIPEGRHFFLGSTPKTLDLIKAKFERNACGFYSPPFEKGGFSEEEKLKQLKMIKESKADYIWVGLGAPKQERYVVEMAERAGHGVWLAVGAAFDFYAGTKPRAPKALQNLGLEWAFRLASEPRRLAGRYFRTNPQFIKLALKELLC